MKRSKSPSPATDYVDLDVDGGLPGDLDAGRTVYDEESYSDARMNEFAEAGSDTYGRKAEDVDEEEDEAGNRSYWTDRGKDRA
jgi:hypothetical protein